MRNRINDILHQTSEKQLILYQVLVFIILSAGIIVGGYLYYIGYEKEFRSGIEEQLSSVGNLKTNELVRYRNERIGDAHLLFENPAFSSLGRNYLENQEDINLRDEIWSWLFSIQTNFRYNRVYLTNPEGTILISATNTTRPVSSVILENISSLYKTGDVEFIDFYRDEYDDRIYLSLLIPIYKDRLKKEPAGIVVLEITPDEFLYPLISRWPTGSESAETLLFRKEGDYVLYLNKLRFREDIALTYRLPLNLTDRPAVMAALGDEGIVEGVDYRGVPVIASVHEIPDSPWYMVARIDKAEVFQPLINRTIDLIIIVLFFLIGIGGGLYVIHQQEKQQYYKEQLATKKALSSRDALFRGIFNTMPSGAVIYSVQNDGSRGSDYIVTDFNPAGLSIEGISRDEIVGKPITAIRPEIDDFGIVPIFQKVWMTGETVYYPTKIYPSSTEVKWYENYVFRLSDRQIVAIYNDVTENMRTAQALSTSEERLRLSLDAANDGIWDLDVKTGIMTCSPRWFTILGYEPGEITADYDTWKALIHPEDLEQTERRIHELIHKEKGGFAIETRMKTREGGWCWVLTRGKVITWDERNNPVRVVGTNTDISERKTAELNLIESEGRIQTLIQTIPDLVWLKDISGNFLSCNSMFERFVGKREEEIIGKTDYDFFDKDIADFFRDHDQNAIEARKATVNEEWITFAGDGNHVLLETIKTPMYDSDGNLIGVLGIGRDITERNAIKAQIIVQKKRLEQSQAIGHIGSWEYDLQTGNIWGSDEVFLIHGMKIPPGNQLPINRIEVYIQEQERVHQALIDLIEGKKPYNIEYAISPADGSPERTIISVAELIKDDSGTPLRAAGVIQDITARKLAESERESLLVSLRESNEQLNAAFEQLAGSEEELRYQFNALSSTEEHLRQTTQYLESLIANANVPIIVWDPEFTITRINHSCEDLIGRSDREVIGKSIEILFPPDQVEHSMRLLTTTRAGVRWDTVEMDIQHRDGSTRSVIWNSSTIYDAKGSKPIATIAQGQDITVKKRLENENRLSLAQIQKNLAQLAILNDQIRNPLTLILSYTEASDNCDIIGDISEQVRQIDDIVTNLDQRWIESEKILHMLQKNYNIIASPSAVQAIQIHSGRIDDEIRDREDTSQVSYRLLVQEIEAELYTILDSIDAYIFVADLETYELLYLNKFGRNLFGDIAGKKCYEVIEKDQTGPCPFCTNHLLMDEIGPTGVHQHERRNTRNGRWYDCREQVIRWSNARFVHLQIATDITERKATEDELKENEYTFRKLFEESSDPILLMQNDRFIECNQAALDLLKFTKKEQLIGSNPAEISPEYQPDGRLSKEAAAEYISTAHEKGSYRFEWMCRKSDGTLLLLEVSLLSIMFKGEEMLHITWRDITKRKEAEIAIIRSKTELKQKLDAILSPEGDIGTLNLSDIIDVPEIQQLMDDFYSVTKIGVAILDIQGNILVATGWQEICTRYHRVHPETCKNCIESDTQLSAGVTPGTFRLYRCRNNMWDIATPIMVGGVHLGNLFLGQFLFDDETIDYSFFREQARIYGFDEKAYIEALERVPRWSREIVDTVMRFYTRLVYLISDASWSSIRLARILTERDTLISTIQTKKEQLEDALKKSQALTEELHERDEELRHQMDEIRHAKHEWK